MCIRKSSSLEKDIKGLKRREKFGVLQYNIARQDNNTHNLT